MKWAIFASQMGWDWNWDDEEFFFFFIFVILTKFKIAGHEEKGGRRVGSGFYPTVRARGKTADVTLVSRASSWSGTHRTAGAVAAIILPEEL